MKDIKLEKREIWINRVSQFNKEILQKFNYLSVLKYEKLVDNNEKVLENHYLFYQAVIGLTDKILEFKM